MIDRQDSRCPCWPQPEAPGKEEILVPSRSVCEVNSVVVVVAVAMSRKRNWNAGPADEAKVYGRWQRLPEDWI
jgi:hypothetical protein